MSATLLLEQTLNGLQFGVMLFLMSAGLELPKRVMIHGFLHNQGVKMSKSLGNVVAPADWVAQYGLDQVRYFFLREIPFGADGNYNHEAIVGRMNSDLANNFGNLAQRSLSMVAKNCEGRVPAPGAFTASFSSSSAESKANSVTPRWNAPRIAEAFLMVLP